MSPVGLATGHWVDAEFGLSRSCQLPPPFQALKDAQLEDALVYEVADLANTLAYGL